MKILSGPSPRAGEGEPSHPQFKTGVVIVSLAVARVTHNRKADLGIGYATSPALHTGSGEGSNKVSVFTQLSTGTIVRSEAGTVDSVRSGKRAWREIQ
ncbi:MAG: hypothetical protein M0T76_04600 [Desulfobacteraceae bacterium]|nr:hypothetical protein [Desulfobacteraceae bacterium]